MADRNNPTSRAKAASNGASKKAGGEAELIHDLATAPPAKDLATVKAASDVSEANRKHFEPKQKARAHG